MRVSVFGLGYVGVVSSGCMARDGFDVVGVDVNPEKVRLLNAGRSPIVEAQVEELIAAGVAAGRLRATGDAAEAVAATELSLISVGTPSDPAGALDLAAVERVAGTIGRALTHKPGRHLIVMRSTVLPGTLRTTVVPLLERSSGKNAGEGFGICCNPEFLRESSSVSDYDNPPYTLIGSDQRNDGETVARLYHEVSAPVIHCGIETAELVKCVSNAFHALKVTFANEVGILAQAMGVNGLEVMELICRDTKLNISPSYLRPGFAFGGSCLPKDVNALVAAGRARGLELPLLVAIPGSNRAQIDRAVRHILRLQRKKIGILGLSFKAGTDDLRGSPLVSVTEALVRHGCEVRIYDHDLHLARLLGANREYAERELPHLASWISAGLREVVDHAEVLVLGNGSPEFTPLPAWCRAGQVVVDLTGQPATVAAFQGRPDIEYHGIAW